GGHRAAGRGIPLQYPAERRGRHCGGRAARGGAPCLPADRPLHRAGMSVAGSRARLGSRVGAVALSAEHLSFRYPALPNQRHGKAPGAPAVLQDVSFALHDGEWLVVLGPTGCGKSTLCAVLAGLAPQLTGGSLSGSIAKTDGTSIGLVFQDADAQLFNMTAADEIAFGLET